LRAIAVLAVVANHFNEDLLPSGFLGVDIFFAISGYVITSSLFGHRGEELQSFLLGFYARRFKRLLPALIACVLATGIAMAMVHPNPGISLRTGFASLFGLSNIYLYGLSSNYFAPSAKLNSFTHTWSLGVEEQFYLLFPLIFWVSGIAQRRSQAHLRLGMVMAVLSCLSLIGFIHLSAFSPSASFFLMPWRFWEMGSGVLLYVVVDKLRLSRFAQHGLVPLIAIILIGASFTLTSSHRVISTPLVVALTAILIATIRPGQWIHSGLRSSTMVTIGVHSYSIYLWHWSVLVIARWTVGLHPWTVPVLLAIIACLSRISYLWIETPLRRKRWTGSDASTITSGFAALGTSSAILIAVGTFPGHPLYLGDRKAQGRRPMLQPSKLLASYQVSGFSGPGWHGEACVLTKNSDVSKKIKAENCQLGKPKQGKNHILVLGNSYAPSLIRAFDAIVRNDNISVTLLASFDASPVQTIPNNGEYSVANNYFWTKIAPKNINKLARGDILFLVSDLASLTPAHTDNHSEERLRLFKDGLVGLSRQVSGRGASLAILAPTPLTREANCVPEQVIQAFGNPCNFIDKDKTLARHKPVLDILDELSRKEAIKIVDIMPILCPGVICTYQSKDGAILYRDSLSHPSNEAAKLVAPVFRRALTANQKQAPG